MDNQCNDMQIKFTMVLIHIQGGEGSIIISISKTVKSTFISKVTTEYNFHVKITPNHNSFLN